MEPDNYAVEHDHPEYGRGWFFSPDAVESFEVAIRADQIEKDAQIAAGDHRPTGYGIGALNSGSRSQWYSRGRDQAGDAIRAQLKGVSDE